MSNFFELSTRVLSCDHCGAPVEVPIEGGQVSCRYCNATVIVTARPVIQPRAATSADVSVVAEGTRLAKLREQNPNAEIPPLHLLRLCSGLLLETDKRPRALELFQAARKKLAEGDDAEAERDLYFLAILFSNYYRKEGDYLRLRAFLESALEAAPAPRISTPTPTTERAGRFSRSCGATSRTSSRPWARSTATFRSPVTALPCAPSTGRTPSR